MDEHKKFEKGISKVVVVLVLVVVALSGIMVYIVLNHSGKITTKTTITSSAKAAQSSNSTSQISKINALINQGDYQGLTAYMATSVKVIKEGTDANGTIYNSTTAAATIANFYSQTNTSQGSGLPWDFTGDNVYKEEAAKSTGAVKAYIGQGNIAVSKNNWVLAYNLNSNQQITSFYMSPSVNLSK